MQDDNGKTREALNVEELLVLLSQIWEKKTECCWREFESEETSAETSTTTARTARPAWNLRIGGLAEKWIESEVNEMKQLDVLDGSWEEKKSTATISDR